MSPLRQRHARLRFALIIAVGLYVTVYLRYYLASPAGRFPLLDGAENMDLARQLAAGTLPAAPFYRAMLYPAFLALFLRTGVPPDWLPFAAGFLGAALHAGSTICVYWLARRAWASGRAGLAAAALFGFNPVAVYFAAEPLDTTLGLFLFLGGLNLLHATLAGCDRLRERADAGKFRTGPLFCVGGYSLGLAGTTSLWVLATLTRPHYGIVLAGLPIFLAARLWRSPRQLALALTGVGLPAALGLGAAGLVQKHYCGEFRVMPVQGAYNFWAGNRPGANGRYFEQQLHLAADASDGAQNPARVESETLYRRETGDRGPLNFERMNAYWRSKTLASIRAEPLEWAGLMARKVYYLFNNFEQYNNKTFAIQKGLSPALRLNPLGWGLTLLLCVAGLVAARLAGRRGRATEPVAVIAGMYGAGVVMFFVSDRFRLPLLPLLCIGAGSLAVRRCWQGLAGSRGAAVLLAALVAGLSTFSRAWGVHDLSPARQDYVLLAIAAGKAGDDRAELRWARRALACQADHPDALACAVTGFYNSELAGIAPESEFPDETWQLQCERAARIEQPSSGVRLAQAVALWKCGRTQDARDLLRSMAEADQRQRRASSDDALGVLLLTGLAEAGDEERAALRVNESTSFYLLAAWGRRDSGAKWQVPATRRDAVAQAEPFVKNLFP